MGFFQPNVNHKRYSLFLGGCLDYVKVTSFKILQVASTYVVDFGSGNDMVCCFVKKL